jgi:hypothetical protein
MRDGVIPLKATANDIEMRVKYSTRTSTRWPAREDLPHLLVMAATLKEEFRNAAYPLVASVLTQRADSAVDGWFPIGFADEDNETNS